METLEQKVDHVINQNDVLLSTLVKLLNVIVEMDEDSFKSKDRKIGIPQTSSL